MKKILFTLLPLITILISCSKQINNYEMYFHPSLVHEDESLIIRNKSELLEIGDECF